jgi:hypothetical protein
MKKKIAINLLIVLLPFIATWVAVIMTGFAFNPYHIFHSDVFWFMSIIYWAFIQWIPLAYFNDLIS